MKIVSVVGARPNFMKIAPFIKAIQIYNQQNAEKIYHILVHTGQHYDDRMSLKFFEELNIPVADINLGVGSGSHAEQVGKTMIEFEKVLIKEKPDWVVVVGDVNATLACSITAKKLQIKVCHIEAGLRSNDNTMPEEINRLVTDRLSDLLLTPDKISSKNLIKEGIDADKIKFVGNIMIDTLDANIINIENIDIKQVISQNLIQPKTLDNIESNFGIITLHRPSNVDEREVLEQIVDFFINDVGSNHKIIWPLHPRAAKNLKQFDLWDKLAMAKDIYLLHPIGYLDMLKLNSLAKFILTDSGGLQEESCVLGTPCLTLRLNTERPVTLKENGGLSILVGNNILKIKEEFLNIENQSRSPYRPELWDGNTAKRCVETLVTYSL